MLVADETDNQEALFIVALGLYLYRLRVTPDRLIFDKVDAVFLGIAQAFGFVVLKGVHE